VTRAVGPGPGLLLILGALSAFAPLSIDMYLPAFPAIEADFGVGAGAAQATLATFFIGFALGQAFFGPVTDAFGRKPPLYASLSIYAAASAGCALATSVETLAALRFLQAIGACAGGVVARAMVRDLFDPRDAPRIYGALMLVTGAAPILAPLLGGWVLVWFGWPAIFWTLGGVGLACLAAVALSLPETHPPEARRRLALVPALAAYGRLLADGRFVGHAMAGGMAMAGMFAYIAGSPFVFIELHGVSPQHYGWLFGANAFGLIGLAQVNGRLLAPGHAARTLRRANLAQAAVGAALAGLAVAGAGGLPALGALLFVYVASLGFTLPNATALAMAPHGANAGAASALLGTLQFSAAAVAAAAVGWLHDGSAAPMAGVIAFCGIAALACNLLLARRH